MAREIKFRIWNPSGKNMLYDIDNVFECLKQQIKFDQTMPDRGFVPAYDHRSEGMVWDQYAGFKDKNGTDVYENDIVEAWSAGSKRIFRIIFRQEGSPCWLLYPNGQNRQFWNIHVTEYSKDKQFISLEGKPYKSEKEGFYDTGLIVIGNYHENQELLNPTK